MNLTFEQNKAISEINNNLQLLPVLDLEKQK